MEVIASPVVPSARFCLSALPPCDRAEAFRDRLRGSWEANLIETQAPFEMTSALANVGGMVLSSSVFPTREVSRTRALVRAAPLEHYCIQVTFAASGLQVETDGNEVSVGAGQPILLDLGRPFKSRQGSGRSLQAFAPRAALDSLASSAPDLHGTPLRGAAAMLLVDQLQAMTDHLDELPASAAAEIAQSTFHLLAASIGNSRKGTCACPKLDAALMRQACYLIDERLWDPELDVAHIAKALRISRATLYRLFEEGGGVARHIKERRLERIHAILSASGDRPCLASIAEAYGFKSGGHFSRAFLGHFGYRPSEVVPADEGVTGEARTDSPSGTLSDWLRPRQRVA